ncbi:MAG: exonuclease domain-containing protein [Oscillospiraceae bacterium]
MIYTDEYVVFDIETTGLSTTNDEIIEIGAIKTLGTTQKRFRSYVKPTKEISIMAKRVNGINNAMLENAPTIDIVIVKFLDFIGDLPLIAHNSSFDISFIKREALKYCGKTVENPVIDTVRLAKKYYPDLENYKLETIKNYFGVPVQSLHNTMDDCIVTSYFYQRLKNDIPEFQNEFYNQVEEKSVKIKNTETFAIDTNNNVNIKPQEFSKEEMKFFDKIKSILQSCNSCVESLKISKTKNYLDILYYDDVLFRFKLNGTLRYWLLDIPYSEFENKVQTDFTYTKSTANEGDKTRLFIEDFTDLDIFSDIIINKFNQVNNISVPIDNNNDTLLINVRGKIICLTGDFNFGTREEVQIELTNHGAVCKSSVTKKTDFLITGSQGSQDYKFGNVGTKYKKALELQQQGIDINILKENEVFKTAITV